MQLISKIDQVSLEPNMETFWKLYGMSTFDCGFFSPTTHLALIVHTKGSQGLNVNPSRTQYSMYLGIVPEKKTT